MKRTTTFQFMRHASGALLITSVMVLAGCVKGSVLDTDNQQTEGVIRIGSTIEGSTRAVALNTSVLTDVKFLRRDVAGSAAPGNYNGYMPVKARRATDGGITFDTEQTYKLNNDNAFFVAYWPQGTETAGTSTRWTIDGATDILVSAEYNAGNNNAPLNGTSGNNGTPMTFSHRLAQLEVVCKADPDMDLEATNRYWGQITRIEVIEALPQATFAYATRAVTFGGTATAIPLLKTDYQTTFAAIDVPAKNNTAANAAAMLAPTTDNFVKLRISTSRQQPVSLTVTFPASGIFEQGKRHTVPLVFKSTGEVVVIGQAGITDWNTAYNGTFDETIAP